MRSGGLACEGKGLPGGARVLLPGPWWTVHALVTYRHAPCAAEAFSSNPKGLLGVGDGTDPDSWQRI